MISFIDVEILFNHIQALCHHALLQQNVRLFPGVYRINLLFYNTLKPTYSKKTHTSILYKRGSHIPSCPASCLASRLYIAFGKCNVADLYIDLLTSVVTYCDILYWYCSMTQ